MNELVLTNNKGQDITTSLIIAEVFGKRHADVLRDIENLSCSQQFRERNFALSYYITIQGREMPMYEITKDGFTFLAMGYNGMKAGEFKELFIAEFNNRTALLKNDDYIINRAMTVLNNRTKALEQEVRVKDKIIKIQESAIKEQEHKVLFSDAVSKASTDINVDVFAKLISNDRFIIGRNKLFQWFVDNKILFYSTYLNKKGRWVRVYRPYQRYIQYFNLTETTVFDYDKRQNTLGTTVYITGKGQVYLTKKIHESFGYGEQSELDLAI